MRYVLYEVVSDHPGPEAVETFEDWDDFVDSYDTDTTFPLGEPCHTWNDVKKDGEVDYAMGAQLVVRLNKSHGYEAVGILMPETASWQSQAEIEEEIWG